MKLVVHRTWSRKEPRQKEKTEQDVRSIGSYFISLSFSHEKQMKNLKEGNSQSWISLLFLLSPSMAPAVHETPDFQSKGLQ